jgi:hypothetical protein
MKAIMVVGNTAVSKEFDESKSQECMAVFQEALDNGAIVIIVPTKMDEKLAISKLQGTFKQVKR